MVELNQDNQQEPITSLNHSHNHFFTYPEIDENSRFFSAQDHNFPALNAGGSPQKEKKKKKKNRARKHQRVALSERGGAANMQQLEKNHGKPYRLIKCALWGCGPLGI